VVEVNSIADSIAALNKSITLFSGGGSGAQPNDLLDQRGELIRKLAEKVTVTTVAQDDGALNVFIGNGQPLVLGATAGTLSVTQNVFDPQIPEISFGIGGSTAVVTNNISGGILGGALEFRGRVLDDTVNSLGRIAIGIASDFNAQHRLGTDLNGNVGGNFFSDIRQNGNGVLGPAIGGSSTNVGTAILDAVIVDQNALTNSDYRINFSAGSFTVTRLTDSVATTFLQTDMPQTVDGVQLSFVSGAAVAGDVFLLRPTRNAASDFALQISHEDEIAAASTVTSSAPIGNAGSASLSNLTVTSSTSMPLPGNIILTYDATNTEFDVSGIVPAGATANPSINYDPATDSAGISATIRIPTASAASVGGFSFTDAATADTLQYNLRINGVNIPLPVNGGGAGANTPNFTEGEAVPTLTELAAAINGQAGTSGVESFVSGGTLYLRNTAGNNADIQVTERLVGATDATDAATGFFGGSLTGAAANVITTLPASGEVTFTLSGVPQVGDTISISNNTSGVGDNRNALALAGLQSERNLINGTASYQDAYGEILVAVGSETRQSQISLDATTVLLRQANAEMQALSGVNLDEEAANLLRFQQSYQAAAQVIHIASGLFDTLLAAVQR